jgi:hypothetical protein
MSRVGLCLGVCALVGVVHCVGDSTITPTDGGGNDVTTDHNTVADTSTDAIQDASACGASPTTDFYVDTATGNDSNNGSAATCAFKTISAALNASKTSYNAKIHVAAGSYSVGETFPLIVDKGRSLLGAGASKTTIEGNSAPYNTTNTGSFLDFGQHYLTMIAGDVVGGTNSLGATTIDGVTIVPANLTTPTANYVGIACYLGNAPNTGTTPPLPAPNLVIKGSTVGPNYDTGVAIGYSSSQQAGCNVSVITSTITGSNVGIATGVCGYGGDGGAGNPVSSWPSSQIGDGTAGNANTFTESGIDIFGEGCGSVQSYNFNHFTSGYRAIVIVTGSNTAEYFEILSNTFDGASGTNKMGYGMHTSAGATINKVNDNTFTNISDVPALDTLIGGTSGWAMNLGNGRVIQAHGNKIHDNDNGVYLGGGPISTFDFSSDGSTNFANQIYCNSKVSSGNGYDLILPTAGTYNFAGNVWDHGSPTTSASTTTSPNGTDIVGAGTATTTSAGATPNACASGRSH